MGHRVITISRYVIVVHLAYLYTATLIGPLMPGLDMSIFAWGMTRSIICYLCSN